MLLIRSAGTAVGLVLLLGIGTARAQILSGQLYSQVYAWENDQSSRQWDTYQGFRLDVRPSKQSNLRFKTNLRLARRGDPAEWDERVYNAYIDWRAPDRRIEARLGRQFVYSGVVNGSVDGLMLRARPAPGLDLRLVGGLSVPFDRPLKIRNWDEGNVLGGYGSYRFGPQAKVDLSYVQRGNDGEVVWRQLGTALSGKVQKTLYYQAQFDYNLEQEEVQGMRYRLTYQEDRWSVSGEFNNQKPRIYEDSFFNIFRIVAFNQLRGGATYRVGTHELGVHLLHTMYEEDETGDELIASVGGRWGSVGGVYQTGFGGDNAGVFGEVRYDLLQNLTFRLQSSYYNYQRRSIAFHEDATAFSGGFHYRPVPSVLVQAELQESLNSYYDNDLRALLRVNYAFNNR